MGYTHNECGYPVWYNKKDGKYSPLQRLCLLEKQMTETVETVESFQDELNKKEDSSNIANARKLSELGDFKGTWFGESYEEIIQRFIELGLDITEYQGLVDSLIETINNRESIGLIYDGGNFPFIDPPETIIDGGTF